MVMDNTGDTKLLVFDKNAQDIVSVSAEDLLDGNWDEVTSLQLLRYTILTFLIRQEVLKTFVYLYNRYMILQTCLKESKA